MQKYNVEKQVEYLQRVQPVHFEINDELTRLIIGDVLSKYDDNEYAFSIGIGDVIIKYHGHDIDYSFVPDARFAKIVERAIVDGKSDLKQQLYSVIRRNIKQTYTNLLEIKPR